MTLITIIGRGHGGTRAMSHTLQASGVYMGHPLNVSGDLLPPDDLYEACRLLSPHVTWRGGLSWDFSALHTMPIPQRFIDLIDRYLVNVHNAPAPHKGWKIPETTLVFPWIVRLYPEIHYIHWVRNPRDNILARHLTDDLADFGIAYPAAGDFLREHYPALAEQAAAQGADVLAEVTLRLQRAISWQYQYEIVKATPKPAHWLRVRFEDFVINQAETLRTLAEFLGLPLQAIPVRAEAVGRYGAVDGVSYFDFLGEGMHEFGYAIPADTAAGATQPTAAVNSPHSQSSTTQSKAKEQQIMPPRRNTRKRRPNIILFGIDSLRADHMSSYGYNHLTTPHLDRFAQEGALFERNFSPSIPTTPA
ncbi:MAG: sulfotransferase, partial [Caldilineaceae bacterium]|nr:sulfotransferase [Caldilineaceae bacterium]